MGYRVIKLTERQTADFWLSIEATYRIESLWELSSHAGLKARLQALPDTFAADVLSSPQNTPSFAFHISNMGICTLYINGTRNIAQALNQFGGWAAPLTPMPRGNASAAAFRAADVIMSYLDNYVVPIRNLKGFTIFGHSYGGAIAAAVASLQYPLTQVAANLITFGSPKPGDYEFVTSVYHSGTYRFLNDFDPVPTLPPNKVEAPSLYFFTPSLITDQWERYYSGPYGYCLNEIGILYKSGEAAQVGNDFGRDLALWAASPGSSQQQAHLLSSYRARLIKVVESIGFVPPLYVDDRIATTVGSALLRTVQQGLTLLSSRTSSNQSSPLQQFTTEVLNDPQSSLDNLFTDFQPVRQITLSLSAFGIPSPSLLPTGVSSMAKVPRIYKPYVQSSRGYANVTWMDQAISLQVRVGQAKTFAKKIGALLERIMSMDGIEADAFLTAFQLWVASAQAGAPPWVYPFPPHV